MSISTKYHTSLPLRSLHSGSSDPTVSKHLSCTWWQECSYITVRLSSMVGFYLRSRESPAGEADCKAGYLPQDFPTFEELAGTADHQLFKSIITNLHHVLRRYFPEKKPSGYNLRPRVHNCELPVKDYQNFVPHTIYGELKLK